MQGDGYTGALLALVHGFSRCSCKCFSRKLNAIGNDLHACNDTGINHCFARPNFANVTYGSHGAHGRVGGARGAISSSKVRALMPCIVSEDVQGVKAIIRCALSCVFDFSARRMLSDFRGSTAGY